MISVTNEQMIGASSSVCSDGRNAQKRMYAMRGSHFFIVQVGPQQFLHGHVLHPTPGCAIGLKQSLLTLPHPYLLSNLRYVYPKRTRSFYNCEWKNQTKIQAGFTSALTGMCHSGPGWCLCGVELPLPPWVNAISDASIPPSMAP